MTNRVLASPDGAGSGTSILAGGDPWIAYLDVNYVIMDDTDAIVASKSGSTSVVNVPLTYAALADITAAVTAAIQTQEDDSTLEVFLV